MPRAICFEIDVVGQRLVARVDLEDRQPALPRRAVDGDVAVEAAGTQQRRVEHVGAVGRRHDDDRFVRLETVHFAEDLVERLLAFIGAAADTGAAHAADGVDFVDEQDAGGILLGRLEHVANPAGPHADEHLDEFGTVDAEKRHARLAGHGSGQQRLAGAGRAHQQHALGHDGAETLELLRAARNSTTSCSSLLAFCMPATSSKVMRICSSRSAWRGF